MATMAGRPLNLYPQRACGDRFARYADPLQHFASPAVGMAFMADPILRASLARSGRDAPPYSATPMSFEAPFYADTPSFMSQAGDSPSPHPDDGDFRLPSARLSSASAPSSALGSPQSHHGQPGAVTDWSAQRLSSIQPRIVGSDYVTGPDLFPPTSLDDFGAFDFAPPPAKSFVDPPLIHPDISRPLMTFPPYDARFPQHTMPFTAPTSVSVSPQTAVLRANSSSPFYHHASFQSAYTGSPYGSPLDISSRQASLTRNFLPTGAPEYHSGDETVREKQRCTLPNCGKVYKDIKAHMLTHQTERPEKCPIQTCEYHTKGFARKYDKNRHTLTHYKGTMVCGFCPGPGSPAEKSFNRADVFKRHLTSVHGVEQTPPNSRRKVVVGVVTATKLTGYAPDATGKCSTCSKVFFTAQDFYEHLDDCVLRIVQMEDPSEAINAQRLGEVQNDRLVHQTLEKNRLPTSAVPETTTPLTDEEEDDDEEEEEKEDDDDDVDEEETKMEEGGDGDGKDNDDDTMEEFEEEDDDDYDDDETSEKAFSMGARSPSLRKKSSSPKFAPKSRGITHSRGGVPPSAKARARKTRRDYPSSWGFDRGQVNMRKRIMAVFDGPRRLVKDDMLLSTDHEVRIKLANGESYVTDLDVQTLKRAKGFLAATDEEKGPWISDDPTQLQVKEMQKKSSETT